MPAPTPTGVTLTAEHRADRKSWVERNPLRVWRLRQQPRVTILEAAELIGVGMSMLQMYERGVHKPGPGHAPALAGLLGEDWSSRWDEWLASRPAL